MDREILHGRSWLHLWTRVFLRVEHGVYIGLAFLLSITAVLALGSAAYLVWESLRAWSGTDAVFVIIDRLLFVLMLVEILHTVSASIRSGELSGEPFLIVGLIASIRRVLVITLESSEVTHAGDWSAQHETQFRSSMIELAVLGLLILIMVFSIHLLHRSRTQRLP